MRRAILTVLLLLGALGWLGGCHHDTADTDRGKEKKIALHIPKEPPKRPQGSAALAVKTGAVEPFTKQDVADYFKTHNLPRNSTSTSDFAVDTLEFLTNKEVTTRLNGASPGLAENDKIGFATLKGLFIFTGPRQASPVRFKRAYAAFDASTGNLLMIGTLEREEHPR
jgi:hypothetical protein